MNHLKSQVGPWKLQWRGVPRGLEGTVHVEVESGPPIEVSWRKDGQGIWIYLPDGVFGFDLAGSVDDNGQTVYRVTQRHSNHEWNGVSCNYGDIEPQALNRAQQNKAARVRAQMPGKMIRVLTQVGNRVEKDQPLAVMEAMKMENEIRAPQAGKVSQVKVTEGQVVETGADLILIEVE